MNGYRSINGNVPPNVMLISNDVGKLPNGPPQQQAPFLRMENCPASTSNSSFVSAPFGSPPPVLTGYDRTNGLENDSNKGIATYLTISF